MGEQRPPRPETPDGALMSDPLWELVNRCWTHQPPERPTASEVARDLKAIIDRDPGVSELPKESEANIPPKDSAPAPAPVLSPADLPAVAAVAEEAPISSEVLEKNEHLPDESELVPPVTAQPLSITSETNLVDITDSSNPVSPQAPLNKANEPEQKTTAPLEPPAQTTGSRDEHSDTPANPPNAHKTEGLGEATRHAPSDMHDSKSSEIMNGVDIELQTLPPTKTGQADTVSSADVGDTIKPGPAEVEKGSKFREPTLTPPAPYNQPVTGTGAVSHGAAGNGGGQGEKDSDRGCFPFNICCR